MNDIPQLTISIIQAARMLGLGRSTIYKAIAAGKLQVRKLGRRSLVEVSAVEEFIKQLPQANGAATHDQEK